MAAILVLVGIAILVIVASVLVKTPARRQGVMTDTFWWDKTVRVGKPAWVTAKSRQKPSGDDVRNIEVHNAGQPGLRYYTYERRVWQQTRTVRVSDAVIDITPPREPPPAERRTKAPGATREG